jgi:hypothetical protein
VLTVGLGLGIRAASAGDVAKYAGDALYTVLLHTLAVAVAPRLKPLTTAWIALGVSWTVELLQLTGAPAALSRVSIVARLVLGSAFNAPDLVWYAVGALFAFLVHTGARACCESPAWPTASGTP